MKNLLFQFLNFFQRTCGFHERKWKRAGKELEDSYDEFFEFYFFNQFIY